MAACLLVATVALVCSIHLVAPLGDSKDGVNAGTWGLASRTLRETGVGPSRWGAKAEDRTPEVYVNHPPLVIAAAAASEGTFGEHPWSSRLPSLLATCVAAVLVLLVAVELRHPPLLALAATALALGAPMLRTYGSMLDTPMIGLPFGVGLTLLWLRSRNRRPSPPLAWGLLGLGAGLSSWLGWPIAVAIVIGLAIGRQRRAAVALTAGSVLAGALLLLWFAQSGAGVAAAFDVVRTTSVERASISLAEGLRANLVSAYPPWTLLLALPGAVLALWSPASRTVVALWWGTIGVWSLAFQERAATHEYWTWWAVVPLALGWARLLEVVLARVPARTVRLALPVAAAAGLAGALLPSPGWSSFEDGQDAGRLLSAATYPSGQQRSWVLTTGPDILPWVSYRTRLSMAPIRPSDLDDLVAHAPGELVLAAVTSGSPSGSVPSATCLPAHSVRGRYAVVAAATLSRSLQPGCSGPDRDDRTPPSG